MKRVVFLVDKEKKEEVKKLLDKNEITWSDESRFHFDFRTAVVTAAAVILMGVILVSIF